LAAFTCGSAIKYRLDRDVGQTASFDAGSSLDDLNGTEGPARLTRFLVLDRSGALALPVDAASSEISD